MSAFSLACWPFVYLFQRYVVSNPLPYFDCVICLFIIVCELSLYILDIHLSSDMICRCFFHSVGYLITTLTVSHEP